MRCAHAGAVPVESIVTGEVLAALCPDCGEQLSAEFLTCPHADVIDIVALGELPGQGICNGCGTSGWFEREPRDPKAAMAAQLVASGWDPASVHRAVAAEDFLLLEHRFLSTIPGETKG